MSPPKERCGTCGREKRTTLSPAQRKAAEEKARDNLRALGYSENQVNAMLAKKQEP